MKHLILLVLLLAAPAAHAQFSDCSGFWEEKVCFRGQDGKIHCICVDKRRTQ